jgi:hypothetical protein
MMIVAMLLGSLVACSRQTGKSHRTSIAFQKAADPRVFFTEREKAASELSAEERALLRDELTSELPGDWDKATLDAIYVLGEVGDADTVMALDKIDKMPRDAENGKVHGVIIQAVAKILKRLPGQVVPRSHQRSL